MNKPTLRQYFQENPDLFSMWSNLNNDKMLDLTIGSERMAYWTCPSGHKDVEMNIRMKILNPKRCRVCRGKELFTGINDLETMRPDIAAEWSERNDKKPSEVKYSASIYPEWKCSNGHYYVLHLPERTRKDRQSRGCPTCTQEDFQERKRSNPNSTSIVSGNGSEEMQEMFVRSLGKVKYPGPKSKIICLWRCREGHEWECIPRYFVGCLDCNPPRYNFNTKKSKRGISKVLVSILQTHSDAIKNMWDDDRDPETLTKGSGYKARWKCSTNPHHRWTQNVYTVLKALDKGYSACPHCANQTSLAERQIAEMIKQKMEPLGFTVLTSYRGLIAPYEVDIYIPEKKIAIEYNGLYWHSEGNRKNGGKRYHYNKWKACRDKGVQLITIWEDEWLNKEEIVARMLFSKLGVLDEEKVNARSCLIKESAYDEAKVFLDAHHIQGSMRGSFYLSLDHNGSTVAMSVWTLRGKDLVLDRYATSVSVRGGMGRLLKAGSAWGAQKGAERVVTFADHQVSDGGLYETLGFTAEKEIRPDYRYVANGVREHKFNYRLKRFREDSSLLFEEGLSETQLAELNNIERAWDCGKTRYVKRL